MVLRSGSRLRVMSKAESQISIIQCLWETSSASFFGGGGGLSVITLKMMLLWFIKHIREDKAWQWACTCARARVALHLISASVRGKLGQHSRCTDTHEYSGLIGIYAGGPKVKESEAFAGPRQPSAAAVTPLLLLTLDRAPQSALLWVGLGGFI